MNKNKKNIILFIVILVVIFCGIFFNEGVSYARYVSKSILDYYLKTKGFYFNSDYLSLDEQRNDDNSWDGTAIKFNLRNNFNQKIVTEQDINYQVTCEIMGEASEHTTCKLTSIQTEELNGNETDTLTGVLSSIESCKNTKKDGQDVSEYNKTECEINGYEWIYEVSNNELYFHIIKTNIDYEISDIVVKVTASSTYPFKKTISGTFNLHKIKNLEGELILEHDSFTSYGRLILTNTFETNKCVSLSWNTAKVLIDLDIEEYALYEIDEDDYINQIKFNINSNDSKKFIYYKKDKLVDIKLEDFILQETTNCE